MEEKHTEIGVNDKINFKNGHLIGTYYLPSHYICF